MTYTCILVMEVISLENSVAVLLLCSQVVAMDLLDREVAMFLKVLPFTTYLQAHLPLLQIYGRYLIKISTISRRLYSTHELRTPSFITATNVLVWQKLQMLENQSSYTEEKFRNLQRLLRRIASFVKPN
ncbi:uncharacterized protein LOC110036082 isoform X1 [Phalaenopsis equestris]|uniref:uncharacterized protein LOC110036082 isoform X1 n=1 Tax=Phalaenopsis equestris TaxID=78828 RepID=UPI0009E5C860|nr:uncharacterized protein LOC110036082 isoform X1 [Phalaenopsis equestris]